MQIRATAEGDIPTVMEMVRAFVPMSKLTDEVLEEEAKRRELGPNAYSFLAVLTVPTENCERNGEIAGWIGAEGRADGSLYIHNLYVAPCHRRKGIARALLSHLATFYPRFAAVRIHARENTKSGEAPSKKLIEFYKSMGFVQDGACEHDLILRPK